MRSRSRVTGALKVEKSWVAGSCEAMYFGSIQPLGPFEVLMPTKHTVLVITKSFASGLVRRLWHKPHIRARYPYGVVGIGKRCAANSIKECHVLAVLQVTAMAPDIIERCQGQARRANFRLDVC